MSDLDASVPPYEPAEDALAVVAKIGLSGIPVVGPMAVEALAHWMETRQSQRQHEFNVAIARALATAIEQLDGMVTIEDIVQSDEFIAAVTRAQRVASETASDSKRRRLAAAVASGGSLTSFSAAERDQFNRLVEDFTDLHVWLLHYFTDPQAWLDAHGLQSAYQDVYAGSFSGPLSAALGSATGWRYPVEQAIKDLDAAGLASIPLSGMMTSRGVIESRTNTKGRRFLAFLAEPESSTAEPPRS